MKNGWEKDGPLMTAWEEIACAKRACSQLGDHPIVIERVGMAFKALDAARLKAIREETMGTNTEPDYFGEAVARAREQARGIRNLSMLHARQLDGCLDVIERIHRETVANARAQAEAVTDPASIDDDLSDDIYHPDEWRPESAHGAAVTDPESRREVEACLDVADEARSVAASSPGGARITHALHYLHEEDFPQ